MRGGAAHFDGFSIRHAGPHADRLQWCAPFVLCVLTAEMIGSSINWSTDRELVKVNLKE